MSESAFQMLLKLQLSAMITTLGSLFRAHNLFLTPHLSLHWTQLRAVASGPVGAPPLPVRSCSRHEASPQLLCSGLSKPRDLSHSSYTLPSGFFTILVALSFGHSLIALCLPYIVPTKMHPVQEVRLHSAEQRGQPLGPRASQDTVDPLGPRAHC